MALNLNSREAEVLANKLKPYITRWFGEGSTATGTGYAPSPHDLQSGHHTGTLSPAQGPDFLLVDGSRMLIGDMAVASGKKIDGVDISALYDAFWAHVPDPDAHHLGFVGLLGDSGAAAPDGSDLIKLTGGGGISTVGSGNQVILTLEAPGTLSLASINSAFEGGHTHQVSASADPGAAPQILASNSAGGLRLSGQLILAGTSDPLILKQSGDTFPRAALNPQSFAFGGGGVTAPDVWVRRTGVKTALFDDGLLGPVDVAFPGRTIFGGTAVTPAILTARGGTEQFRVAWDDLNYAGFNVGAGGNVTLTATGDIVFDPVGNGMLPQTNYDLNLGAINKKFLTLHAAELWVETLVAQDTLATIGGRVLVGPTTTLTSDLSGGTLSTVGYRSGQGQGLAVAAVSITLTKPSGVVKDDIMVAVISTKYTNQLNPLTVPTGWIAYKDTLINPTTPNHRMLVYYKFATASEPASYTWTLPIDAVAANMTGGIVAASGVDQRTPFADYQAAVSTTSGSSLAIPSAAPFWANSMLLTVVFGDGVPNTGNRTVTPPSGNTEIFDVRTTTLTNGNETLEASYRLLATNAAVGATTPTFSGSVTEKWGANIILNPAETAPTTIQVKHNQMSPGDIVYGEANGKVEFMQVVSGPTGTGPYNYVMERNFDGTGANQWHAGDALFNTGQTGNGFLDLYSLNAVNGYQLDYVYNVNNTGQSAPYETGVFSANYAYEVNFSLFGDGAASLNGCMYYGLASNSWNNLYHYIKTAAVGDYTSVWEYWNGSAWTPFTPTAFGSIVTLGVFGVEFTTAALTNWTPKTVNGALAYWIRCRLTVFNSSTTLAKNGSRRVRWKSCTWGPTVSANVRNSLTYNDWDTRTALGNLNGLFDYGNDIFGFAAGKYSTTWIAADEVNGFRVMNGTVQKGKWAPDGSLMIGNSNPGVGNLYVDPTGNLFLRTGSVINVSFDTLGNGFLDGNLSIGAAPGARTLLSNALNGGIIGYGVGDTFDPITGVGTYEVRWNKNNGKLYAANGNMWLDQGGTSYWSDSVSTWQFGRGVNWYHPGSGELVATAFGTYGQGPTYNTYRVDAMNRSDGTGGSIYLFASGTLSNNNTQLSMYAGKNATTGGFPSTKGSINLNSAYLYFESNNQTPGTVGSVGMQFRMAGAGPTDKMTFWTSSGTFPVVNLEQGYFNTSGFTGREVYTDNWFRVKGGGGIYWEAFGGGWYMNDKNWIRNYNGKMLSIDTSSGTQMQITGSGAVVRVNYATSLNPNNTIVNFFDGNSFNWYSGQLAQNVMTIYSGAGFGRVGIRKDGPAYALELGLDSAAKPGSGTWTVVSDGRTKEAKSLRKFSRGLDALMELPDPQHFQYKPGIDPDGREHAGWVAQDLEGHPVFGHWVQKRTTKLPRSVAYPKKQGHYSDKEGAEMVETEALYLDYGDLPIHLAVAVKELTQLFRAEIKSLKQEIKDLRGKK